MVRGDASFGRLRGAPLSLVLAGCNGLTLGENRTPAPTLTPAAVPTDEPTAIPVPRLAPGLTANGVTDSLALGDAHASVLDTRSYTVHERSTTMYANGTVYTRGTTDARLAADDGRYHVVQKGSGVRTDGTSERALWSDGKRVIVAETTNDTTAYEVPRGREGEPVSPDEVPMVDPTNHERIYAYFGAVDTRVTDRESRNGTRRYRVEATEMTAPSAFEVRWRNPRNLSLVAFVDSRGLLHEYRLHYTATLNGDVVRVHERVRYTDLGETTVERPRWYDDAIENVSTAEPTTVG